MHQRQFPRQPIALEAELRSRYGRHAGTTRNLCCEGAFIAFPGPAVPEYSAVNLLLQEDVEGLPQRFCYVGVVTHSRAGGAGVLLLEGESQAWAFLDRLCGTAGAAAAATGRHTVMTPSHAIGVLH